MYIVGGYKVGYKEERKSNGLWTDYVKIVTVYDFNDNSIVLCSRDKTDEEFINYLGFVTNEDVVETAKQLLEKGRTEEDDIRDFIAECAEHEYLWWG